MSARPQKSERAASEKGDGSAAENATAAAENDDASVAERVIARLLK
jgi:hypothetical protein